MKVLPFYTSTGMRDAERVNSQDALLCPVWKFLPFQIQRSHLTGSYIQEAALVDCNGTEIDVLDRFFGSELLLTGWTGSGLNTFLQVVATPTILTAIESDSANSWAYSQEFSLATGESVAIDYNLTLNSGTLPNMLLANNLNTSIWSSSVKCSAGGDVIYLTATGNSSGNVRLLIENLVGNDVSFKCTFTDIARPALNLVQKTTYDFITYNGEPLSTTLPYGVYYLRLTDDKTIWYSEWFSVQNIQPQLLSAYELNTYDTFTTSGFNITSAIELAGVGEVSSNEFTMYAGEIVIFTYDFILNSGEIPTVRLANPVTALSSIVTLEEGLHVAELKSTYSGSVRVRILTINPTNFSIYSASIRRKSGEYVHLEFTNARDFNNGADSIYYAGGFTQQAYLRSYLNIPSHETIEVGSDKNGKFEAEKLVSKYTQSVISYESRSMYNALRLLPLHTTVKILDEVGHEHTPDVGNVQVMPDWKTFDTCSLKILWNEDGTVWTNSSDNIASK